MDPGQAAPLVRSLPAAELVATLAREAELEPLAPSEFSGQTE